MNQVTDILEEHWKRQQVKYSRTGDNLKWNKTLRNVRCAMCGKSSREKKLDEAFPGWGVLLFHFSEAGKMPEVCPNCMKKISDRQIPVPRITVCVGCGTTQREKIFGLGFPGWQTIRFPAQGIKAAAIRITDLWCPDCSVKIARKLGPEFVRGSWTNITFAANSLLTSTIMTNLYTNVTEAAYPHDNLLRAGSFRSWGAGVAAVPEGWTLIAGTVDREAGTVRIGTYSCNVNLGVANARIRQDITGFAFADYGARAFTFGCWVHSDEAAVALIRVSTIGGADVDTDVHTGGGAWEWLTATVHLDAGATGIRVECENNNGGNNHFFDGAVLVESEHVEAFTEHANQAIFDADAPPIKNFLYKDAVVKGWVQFNGVGALAIQDSFNVLSVTDLGVGDYRVNWDTDFANDDYAIMSFAPDIDMHGAGITAGTARVRPYRWNAYTGIFIDQDNISVMAIGDQ